MKSSTPTKRVIHKKHEEHYSQKAYFEWLCLKHFDVYDTTFAIANGGKRTISAALWLKEEGLKRGVCDVFAAHPSSIHHGLFIEFKSSTGKLTPEQRQFIEKVRKKNFQAKVAYSCQEAINITEAYLNGSEST